MGMKVNITNYVAPGIKTVTVDIQGMVCVSPDFSIGNGPWNEDDEEDIW